MNLVGILTPGERVPAVLGNKVVFKDGVPLCSLANGNLVNQLNGDETVLAKVRLMLGVSPVNGAYSPETAELQAIN